MPSSADRSKKKESKNKIIKLEDAEQSPTAAGKQIDQEDVIFALDIGTRTVVGIVGVQDGEVFRVLAAEVLEHKNRAMLDGQIHDIGRVTKAVLEVKEILEKKLGFKLTKVAIAAAGRVLKTCQVKVERELEQTTEIDQELVNSIEMEGIQKAQLKLDEEISRDEKTEFYCVGYSVINYYLNNYVISPLLGHRGNKIGADVLATFLPHVVVDSLYTVMDKAGLEVTNLTLEPIAAINVTIPKDLRLLNLALVDIGAGTSDIAITRDGSVVAYAMAPVAGDEITERVSQHYLVDFNTGEEIKISLTKGKESIRFSDILGTKHNVRPEEVNEVIRPAVEILAGTISQKILEYNHKAPNAVFLIGGGSQVPGLREMVAACLKLSPERVVVRNRDIIQGIKYAGKKLTGPEAITPFGIAITAYMQKGQDFLSVTVNGKKIRLFNSRKLSVADALTLVGFNPGELIGRTGKSLVFTLNGVKKLVRGAYGKAAEIFVNGTQGSLGTVLKAGDNIHVEPAVDGSDAVAKLSDYFMVENNGKIVFNGSIMNLGASAYINGVLVEEDCSIKDGDAVETTEIRCLGDIARLCEMEEDCCPLLVNGKAESGDYILKDGDRVDYIMSTAEIASDSEAVEAEAQSVGQVESSGNASVQKQDLEEQELLADAKGISVIINGSPVLIRGDKTQYIFVDMFNYIQFDLSKPQGNIVLKLNGKQAAFTDVVRAGDVVDIYWEKLI